METPKFWEARKGEKPEAVAEMNMEMRAQLDEIITEKATDYIKRKAKEGVPFFTYIALTHIHPPEAANPKFSQTSPERSGEYGDIIAEQDYRTGEILAAIDEAGIKDNTIVLLCSDNSAGGVDIIPGSSNGPWGGNFFTPPYEGSMRVPAMIRWPGKIPAGVVSGEPFTAVDWYRTFATFAGAADRVPTDRPIDSVDTSEFLLGKAESNGREHVLFAGPDGDMMSVKYGDIKVIFSYAEGVDKPIVKPMFPLVFDLGSDPGEQYNLMKMKMDMAWMFEPAFKALTEYKMSTVKYPNIKPGEEFKGYKDVEDVVDPTKVKIAEYEHHHHG